MRVPRHPTASIDTLLVLWTAEKVHTYLFPVARPWAPHHDSFLLVETWGRLVDLSALLQSAPFAGSSSPAASLP